MAMLCLSGMTEAQEPTAKKHNWDECEGPLQSGDGPKALVVVRVARCFMDLGIYTRAAQVLTKHVDEMDEQGAQGGRAVIEGLLQTALSRVAVIDVKTEKGARLRIDGAFVGSFPAINPIFLEAGEHLIEAQIDDQQIQKRIEVVAGHVGNIELIFGPRKAVGRKDKPESARVVQRQPKKSPWPAWRIATTVAGGLVGVTGTGIGVAYAVSGQNAEQQRSATVAAFPLRTSQCAHDAGSDDCSRVAELVEKRDGAYRTAWGGFVASGVGLAVLVTAIVLPKHRDSSTKRAPNVAAVVVPVPGGATVWMGGTF
ncbi:MAG: hypothetical protein IPM54_25220 [Polyangiaceae bacterium]|nr:hypothetical protein [Polyangiaceae bacterium]